MLHQELHVHGLWVIVVSTSHHVVEPRVHAHVVVPVVSSIHAHVHHGIHAAHVHHVVILL